MGRGASLNNGVLGADCRSAVTCSDRPFLTFSGNRISTSTENKMDARNQPAQIGGGHVKSATMIKEDLQNPLGGANKF